MWYAILLNNPFECEGVHVALISRVLNFIGLVKGQECLCLQLRDIERLLP